MSSSGAVEGATGVAGAGGVAAPAGTAAEPFPVAASSRDWAPGTSEGAGLAAAANATVPECDGAAVASCRPEPLLLPAWPWLVAVPTPAVAIAQLSSSTTHTRHRVACQVRVVRHRLACMAALRTQPCMCTCEQGPCRVRSANSSTPGAGL